MKIALIVYQQEQVPTLVAYRKTLTPQEREATTVVAIGADIELALTQVGIPSYSARTLRTYPSIDRRTYAETVGQGVFADPALAFLTYRAVPFGRVHAHALQRYLDSFLYYLDILHTLVIREAPAELRVMQSHRLGFAGDILADYMERVAADAARLAAKSTGTLVTIVRAPNSERLKWQKTFFHLRRSLFGAFVSFVNAVVTVRERPRPLRLLISDTWRNTASYLAQLPEAEVVLWERTEIHTIGWKNIRTHRMRFMHAHAFTRSSHRRSARRVANEMIHAWKQISDTCEPIQTAAFKQLSLAETVTRAVDYIIRAGAVIDIKDIDDTYYMLESLKPQVVLVRASDSLQTHFSFLCYVARAFGVPSVEVQHGILYLGPGSIASHVSAEYVATYGELASKEFAGLGHPPEKLRATGSPRFDTYAHLPAPEEGEEVHIGYVLSAVDPGLWLDTYDVADTLETLAEATRNLPVRVSVSTRADSPYTPFVKNTMAKLPAGHRIQLATIPAMRLVKECSIFIVGHSTVLFEALLARRAVIHDATPALYEAIKRGSILFTGVSVPVATNAQELAREIERLCDADARRGLVDTLSAQMNEHYVTDGTASTRLAVFVRELAKI